ncbi:hypothetical protein GGE12_002034 [Rhizobium mongolense]|uniref:Uncharacterized protein n=1 Tax=Rhizobium mongolense TaxID=57676 RepID=A0A7W6WE48_9HYPH|nr:hypothetical protein [Rhizobium mongolense]
MVRGRPGGSFAAGAPAPSKASADGIAGQDFAADKSKMIVPATVPHLRLNKAAQDDLFVPTRM